MTKYDKWGGEWSRVDGEDVFVIWSYDQGGYDWSAVALVARRKGDEWEYAVHEDSGCSCRYFMEESPSYYGLAWTTDLAEIKRHLGAGIDNLYGESGIDRFEKKVKALQALREHQREVRDLDEKGRSDAPA